MKNFLLELRNKKNHKTAFSLIELSIVIVIVSILITGALSASVSSVNNAKIKITNERIQTIYKALGTYVMVNGYLPCPGNIASVKSTSANYGGGTGEISTTAAGACTDVSGVYSNTSGSAALAYGMVPVRALGLSNEFAEDGFESKFTYIVDIDFTVGSTLTGANDYPGKLYTTVTSCSAITYPNASIITIQEKPAGTAQTITTAAIFAIISHGANKAGAYNPNSAAQNTRSSDSDEQDNDLTGVVGTTATYDRVLKISSGNSSSFDDIVFYKTRDQLVQDFKAFSFVACPTCDQSIYGTTISWPQGVYDEAVIDNIQCPSGYRTSVYSPVRKCGALGQWGQIIWPCTQ